MDEKFRVLVEALHSKYESLLGMDPSTADTVPADAPMGGVYMFSMGGQHLYVGRTKRCLRDRIKDHVSTAKDCPFAWHLAREATGRKRSYKTDGSRAALLRDAAFYSAYEDAKKKIKGMQVRYVSEVDPTAQALLEIYVAVASGAKYNDFNTS